MDNDQDLVGKTFPASRGGVCKVERVCGGIAFLKTLDLKWVSRCHVDRLRKILDEYDKEKKDYGTPQHKRPPEATEKTA